MHPDALPFGHIVTPFMRCDGINIETGELVAQFQSQESHDAFLKSILDLGKGDPILLKQLCDTYDIPLHEQQYFKFFEKFVDDAEACDDYESKATLLEISEKTNAAEKHRAAEWQQTKAAFQKQIIPSLLEGFSREATQETTLLMTYFEKLRAFKPTSIEPFVPLITVLNQRFQPEDFKKVLQDAKTIDPYQTYGMVKLYLVLTQTHKDRPSTSKNWPSLYDADAMQTIKELWPDDRFFAKFPIAENNEHTQREILIDLSPVARCLEAAMPHFLGHRYRDAINMLVENSDLFVGNTRIYQYLSLAWLLEGDVQKGVQLAVRAATLPEWPKLGPLADMLISTITPHTQSTKATQTPITALLSAFVTLQQRNPHASQATPWVMAMKTVLERATALLSGKDAHEGLPFVYFVLRHIAQKSWPLAFTDYQKLYEPLAKLMAIAHPFYQLGEDITDDTFLKQHIQVIRASDHFHLEIEPAVTSGYPRVAPKLAFFPDLTLKQDSIRDMSIATLHILYNCVVDAITSQLQVPQDAEIPDPHRCRKQWIVAKVQHAIANPENLPALLVQLTTWRDSDTDKPILDWAQRVLDNATCDTLPTLPKIMQAWPNAAIIDKPEAKDLALANAAARRISNRHHQPEVSLPADTATLPDIVAFALSYFGWRNGESFDDWGRRLNDEATLPPPAYKFMLNTDITTSSPLPGGPVENPVDTNITFTEPLNSHISLPVLRILRQAFVDIHTRIASKNAHIAAGGDETNNDQPRWMTTLDRWILDNPSEWIAHIEKQSYPTHLGFSEKQNAAVLEILANKHGHTKEVTRLKSVHATLQKELPPSELPAFYAALLLTNCPHSRQTHTHSVYVGTDVMAENVSRILLEVTITQSFERWLVTTGPSAWRLSRALAKNLHQALLPIGNTFHGPETHLTGNGPTQPHFNAGVWVNRAEFENSHIYFERCARNMGNPADGRP